MVLGGSKVRAAWGAVALVGAAAAGGSPAGACTAACAGTVGTDPAFAVTAGGVVTEAENVVAAAAAAGAAAVICEAVGPAMPPIQTTNNAIKALGQVHEDPAIACSHLLLFCMLA